MPATNDIRIFDARATAVAFPLGGIGTGNVSLGARGDLRDWEIFNRPAKGNTLPFTFFTIRTHVDGSAPVTRVLEGPIAPPHTLSHGYHSLTAAGLPRLAKTTFRGEYPIASIRYEDPALPLGVALEAYTPLIPLNPDDSGIPCAVFTFTVTNPSERPVALSIAGSLTNPVGNVRIDRVMRIVSEKIGQSMNEFRDEPTCRGLYLYAEGIEPDSLHYGSMSLVTDHPNVTAKPIWLRGTWARRTFFDMLEEFWSDFSQDGLLDNLGYDTPSPMPDTGSLGVVDMLEPGANRAYRFVLTWYFPNRSEGWSDTSTRLTRVRYAARFDDAWGVARYVFTEMPRLEGDTHRFHDALFSSTLPSPVIDAISANIVPIRSATCFWLEDGRFFGWEGCHDDAGCCPGSCTHVWSYAYTAAYLFPSLEREMRRIEFVAETEDNGYMNFRTFKTFGDLFVWADSRKPEAAVDGQMGSILRAYREWQLSADKDWLGTIWPGIKRAIAFAGVEWDRDNDGVLDGKQHNTYDIEFHGPNPLGGVYYLAALRAVEELAHIMDEPGLARRCREAFERGSRRLDQLLWTGEYYVQLVEDVDAHPYQHGTGCLSDQLLGQLHAHLLGLGDLLPPEHVRTAVRSIFAHNFRRSLAGHVNPQRTFALNDEAGLLVCSWPHGGRPRFPLIYSDEVWPGIEYQVAAHLILEGLIDDGLEIVKAVWDRHDGIRRNPWDEVECGHHYARSMSSWTLLLAMSGFHCDLARGAASFQPVLDSGADDTTFRTFWSTGRAWGVYTQRRDQQTGVWEPEITVLGGDTDGLLVRACGQEFSIHDHAGRPT